MKWIKRIRENKRQAEARTRLGNIHDELNRKAVSIRLRELEEGCNRLLKNHPIAEKVEDLYVFITDYAKPNNRAEDDYCKDYIRGRVNRGYERYDDQRT